METSENVFKDFLPLFLQVKKPQKKTSEPSRQSNSHLLTFMLNILIL